MPKRADVLQRSSKALGVIGFALYFAWFLASLFGNYLHSPIGMTENQAILAQGAFLVSFAVTSIVFRRIAEKRYPPIISRDSYSFALAFCGLALLLYLGAAPVAAQAKTGAWPVLALSVLAGVPATFFAEAWESICGSFSDRHYAHFLAMSLFGGLVLFLSVECFAAGPGRWLLPSAMLLMSVAIMTVMRQDGSGKRVFTTTRENEYRLIDRRVHYLQLAVTFAAGFAWSVAQTAGRPAMPAVAAILAVGLVMLAYPVYRRARAKRDTIEVLFRVSAVCIAAGCILPLLFDGPLRPLLVLPALVLWLVSWAVIDGLLIQHAKTLHLAISRYLAFGKAVSGVGLAAGWLAASALIVFGARAGISVYAVWAVAGSIIALLLLAAPPLKSLGAEEEDEDPASSGMYALKKQCESFVATHNLTDREADIVWLLAQGRNSRSIAEQLVLSKNTVRSHMYNIYHKAGVHSQQELMLAIEAAANTLEARMG